MAELETRVAELATQIIQNSAQTIAAVKHLYQFGQRHTLAQGLDYERDYQFSPTDKVERLKNFWKEL